MGWLRRSRAYGFYARKVRSRLFGPLVAVPDDLRRQWQERLPGLDLAVDWRDEMYLHFHRPLGRRRALSSYFETGHEALVLLESILAERGRDPRALRGVLEFACGYGRNTRFFATLFDPARLVVSDVDLQALHANARGRGVRALASTTRPQEWSCQERFELVFVASLFTHLPLQSWTPWLARLADVLEPDGLLVITTHGLDWLAGAEDRTLQPEEGFCYRLANETAGRLSGAEYGSTYTSHAWVRAALTALGLEERAPLRPNALWGQDVWVLGHAPAERAAGTSA